MLIVTMLACADWSEDTAGEVLQLNLIDYWPCRESFDAEYVNGDGLTATVFRSGTRESDTYSLATCGFEIEGERIDMHSAWVEDGTVDDVKIWLLDGYLSDNVDRDGTLIVEFPVILGEPVTGGGATIESYEPCPDGTGQCIELVLHRGPMTGTLTLSSEGYLESFDLDQVPGGVWDRTDDD